MSTLGTLGLSTGYLLLVLALGCSLLAEPKREKWFLFSKIFYCAAGAIVFWCTVLLGIAFFLNDFSLRYVVEHSSLATPWYYRLSGIWAGREGSSLLWVMFTLGGAVVAAGGLRTLDFFSLRRFYIVASLVGAVLLGIMLSTANPFLPKLVPVSDGYGLNPLLQDWAMIIHPPLLFAGYACLGVVFVLASCDSKNTLIAEKLAVWARWAGAALTAGIVTGAVWAYDELGWGGYWGWDPVENASLLPWLGAIVLIHFSRRNATKVYRPVVLLAGVALAAAIAAAWLTRSGVVFSLHAFADNSPTWVYLAAMAAVVLYAVIRTVKAPAMTTEWPLSLVAGGGVMGLVAMAVLAGTLWPVWGKMVVSNPQPLSAEFYNSVVGVIGLGLLAVLVWCGLMQIDRRRRIEAGLNALTVSSVVGFGAWFFFVPNKPMKLLAIFLVTANIMLVFVDLLWYRRRFGLRFFRNFAHLGLAILAMGLSSSMVQKPVKPFLLSRGESRNVGAMKVKLEDIRPYVNSHDGTCLVIAELKIKTPHGEVTLSPRQRLLANNERRSDPDYHTGFLSDVYAVLEDFNGSQAMVSVRVNKGVSWVWAGSAIILLGCILAAIPWRKKPC